MPMRLCGLGRGCLRRPHASDLRVPRPRCGLVSAIPDLIRHTAIATSTISVAYIRRPRIGSTATHGPATASHTPALLALASRLLARATTATTTGHGIIGFYSTAHRVHCIVLDRRVRKTGRADLRINRSSIKVPTPHLPSATTPATASHKVCVATASRHLLLRRKKYAQRPGGLIVRLPPPDGCQDRHLIVGQ